MDLVYPFYLKYMGIKNFQLIIDKELLWNCIIDLWKMAILS